MDRRTVFLASVLSALIPLTTSAAIISSPSELLPANFWTLIDDPTEALVPGGGRIEIQSPVPVTMNIPSVSPPFPLQFAGNPVDGAISLQSMLVAPNVPAANISIDLVYSGVGMPFFEGLMEMQALVVLDFALFGPGEGLVPVRIEGSGIGQNAADTGALGGFGGAIGTAAITIYNVNEFGGTTTIINFWEIKGGRGPQTIDDVQNLERNTWYRAIVRSQMKLHWFDPGVGDNTFDIHANMFIDPTFTSLDPDVQVHLSSNLGPVPVPAAVWLFASALGLLGWMRREAHGMRR